MQFDQALAFCGRSKEQKVRLAKSREMSHRANQAGEGPDTIFASIRSLG